jgi:hypothetical protein
MQQKDIKDLLLSNIITSDFLLLDKNSPSFLRYTNFIAKHKQTHLTALDIFQLIKSLKQLIRSLQFISRSQQKFLQILVENKQYTRILNLFLKNAPTSLQFLIKNAFITKPCYKSVNQLLLLLNYPLKNNVKVLRNIVQNDIFLIHKINTKVEQNDWGSYKLYNDLNDFKKFLFVVILLDILLNTKANH